MFEDWKALSHGSCMDGAGVGVLFKFFGGKDISFTSPTGGSSSVGQNVNDLAKEWFYNDPRKLLLADISVSVEVAQLLDGRKYDIVLLDHHATAYHLKQYSWCEIQDPNTRCGSKMLYDWIRKQLLKTFDNSALKHHLDNLERYKRFVELVNDYDLWNKQFGLETADLAALHYDCLGQELFIERFLDYPKPELLSQERYLISVQNHKKEKEIEQKKKHVQVVNKLVGGKECRVGFVSVNGYYNEVAEALYTDKDLNIDLVVMLSGNRVSFRAPERSGIDCSKLAEKFGGGGNKRTSGTNLSNIIGSTPLEMVMDKI